MRRAAFQYSKLGRSESGDLADATGIEVGIAVADDHEIDNAEIEANSVPIEADGVHSSDRDREDYKNPFLKVTHQYGRPNLSAIVRDTLEDGADVGVFMCGPTAMTNAVWDAIEREEGGVGFKCRSRVMGTAVAVYQEVFEL